MAHHIDWDNIHLHIHDNDVRYKRRLHRKRLFINCSPADDGSLKKLKTVEDQNFRGDGKLMVACPNVVSNPKPIRVEFGGKRNDVDPDLEMFKEGFSEGGQSLVCKVIDNDFDDVGLKKLENVQERNFLCNDEFWIECSNVVRNPEPIRVKFGTRGNIVDFDFNMFKVDLEEEGHSIPASDIGTRKLKVVQDQDLGNDELRVNSRDISDVKFGTRRVIVDPDYMKYLECLKEDGPSFGSKVEKNDGSSEFLRYEKDELRKECRRKMKGDRFKNVLGKQKGDNPKKLKNDKRKEKRDKVVLRGDVNVVSTKEERSVMPRRDGFSGNSNRYTVTKRSSVVKRGDIMEIISLGKPKESEEVTVSKNYRPSKIIKNKGPLNMDDGRLEYVRKSKNKYEKVEERTCLTRIDHESNMMDTAGKAKRHLADLSRDHADYRKISPRNKQRELVVQQAEDTENLKFSSDIGNIDVMVKDEKFDDSTNAILSKKRKQMIQGRDSVNDNNLRPQYKCDTKVVKYAEVKEENANSLNYDEEDNEHSSDLEILDTDNQQNLSKFEVMKVFNASVIEDNPLSMVSPNDNETPQFREELMDILRRPYSLEEYRSLMQKAKYRHLKGGPEYSDGLKGKKATSTYGKSPLDYHPEVQRRLRQCRKLTKRLNILRGFIYWYGRTCQEGAFKPWLDKSCSAISPSPG